jgi:quercetin dioxygenase-like cupin family protein
MMMTRSIVLLLLVHTPSVFAQAPVPMHEEPRHRLLLTHEQLRVMDVKIRPGDTTLFHIHDVPALYVAVSAAPVDIQLLDGKWGGTHPAADPGRKPGDVNLDTSYVRQPITHRVTNVGSQLFNLIAITNSSTSPTDLGSAELPGGLELQSRWFTQSRARLSAGATQEWHSHPSPTIVVQPLPGAATVLLESGERHVLNTPGSWALVPAGARYKLTSASSATLVVVQVR